MKLGDWVHCTRCIRKTGNHYKVIPAENTMNNTETALYFEHGAEEPIEVDGFHDCERIKFVDMQFDGVYVGTTTICRRLISIHASLAGGDSKIFPYSAFGTQHMGILANLS